MAFIKIYTTRLCPYCVMAKSLLTNKGVAFDEIRVDGKPDLRAKMTQACGRTSVPQIWIGEQHIGGCDDLHHLEQRGKLDALIRENTSTAS